MQRRLIRVREKSLAAGLVLLWVLILAGCFGPWFSSEPMPTLSLGEPAIENGQGSIRISVADMPNGGLAGIHVALGGLLYSREKVLNLAVEGLNGFIVLIQQFVDGEGGFILVNASGIESGPILQLTFDVHGSVKYGDIQLLADFITLVDDALLMVENWNTPAYYAR